MVCFFFFNVRGSCEALMYLNLLVWGPSTIPYEEGYPVPKEMTEEYMDYVEKAWVATAERCKEVGYRFLLIYNTSQFRLYYKPRRRY